MAALEARLAAAGAAAPAPSTPAAAAPAPAAPQTAAVPPGAEGAGGPSGALPVYGASVGASKVFNPDMAVIGDFLGAAGRNRVNPQSPLELHESEASFQAVVDPYARADFFISFGQEGVDVEEGFLTFTALPGGLLTKVGKMRAAFGKVNTLHNHILSWTDRPLVTQNLVGGEDGIDDAGISVARLIPNPWIFLEATGEVYSGNSAVFQSSKRSDLSYVGHVRGYHDITEDSNVDIGFSYARGNSTGAADEPTDMTKTLYGVDATYRWRPLQRSIYRSFLGRAEMIWGRRERDDDVFEKRHGMYISGDYQFARRWTAGARYDRSQSFITSDLFDTGGAALLTFRPSEFSQVRGQYRRVNYATGSSANELLFQFQFSIGAHGAHPF